MSVVELFCHVDDFWKQHGPLWRQPQLESGTQRRQRARNLCESEIMTILILFHQSHYRTFKAFYIDHVYMHLHKEFPGLVSYGRFVEFIPTVLLPLCGYLRHCFGDCTGISFIDSTSLVVCDNRRIRQHKVFDNLAQRGKTSMGWFYGFKLHLVFNDRGELLNMALTPGNVDDRTPVPDLVTIDGLTPVLKIDLLIALTRGESNLTRYGSVESPKSTVIFARGLDSRQAETTSSILLSACSFDIPTGTLTSIVALTFPGITLCAEPPLISVRDADIRSVESLFTASNSRLIELYNSKSSSAEFVVSLGALA